MYFQVLVKFNDSPLFTPHSAYRMESTVLLLGNKDSEPFLSEDREIKLQLQKKDLLCFVAGRLTEEQGRTSGQLLHLVPQSESAEEPGSVHVWRGEVQRTNIRSKPRHQEEMLVCPKVRPLGIC